MIQTGQTTQPTWPPSDFAASAVNQGNRDARDQPIWLAWGALTVVGVIFLSTVCPSPPFHDFGEWIYQSYLTKYLVTHTLPFASMKKWPVPNSISELIMSILMLALSPVAAARVFIAIYCCVGAFLSLKLSKIHGGTRRGALLVILLCVMVFPTPLWSGETNYQIGLLLLCAYMFWISRREAESLGGHLTDALFGVAIFFSHAICLMAFLVFILLKSREKKTLPQTCLALIPAGLLSLAYLRFNSHMESNTQAELTVALHGIKDLIAYRFYIVSKLGPYSNMITGNIGDFDRLRPLYFFGVTLNLLFGSALVYLLCTWLYSCLRSRRWSAEVITSLGCVGMFLWDPTIILQVATIGERFLLPAVVAAVLLSDQCSRIKLAASVVSGAFCLFLAYWVMILPTAPVTVNISNGAVSATGQRFKLLYWHRPYLFWPGVEAAQRSYEQHLPPTRHIGFQTSLLVGDK